MKLFEIFESISGENSCVRQGTRATFIRFVGCNLRCDYCDTPETQTGADGFDSISIDVAQTIIDKNNKVVIFTGGEPLLQQEAIINILKELKNKDFCYLAIIETNGTILPYAEILHNKSVYFVVDSKLPSCKQDPKLLNNFNYNELREKDIIKFVISDSLDFSIFLNVYKIIKNSCEATIVVSANTKKMTYNELFGLLKQNEIHDVVLNVQIHKFIDLK